MHSTRFFWQSSPLESTQQVFLAVDGLRAISQGYSPWTSLAGALRSASTHDISAVRSSYFDMGRVYATLEPECRPPRLRSLHCGV